MRIGKSSTKAGAAVLEAPEGNRVARRVPGVPALRRDLNEEFEMPDDFTGPARRGGGLRVTVRGGVPQSVAGRVFAGLALLSALGAFVAGAYQLRRYLLHNERFTIASSAAIQILGNSHLSRAQLLSIFGEDVDRNILTVSLAQRRAELEQLPWVEHATVMRLLPDKLRVSIVERTPVAFVREGGRVGLVDTHGVLLDMNEPDGDKQEHYSFPVITGLSANDAASTRLARMKLYQGFRADLDSAGTKISDQLSEVDLSNPEDVKALIPSGGTEILVHFGDERFLERYRKFEENLPKWKTEYPKLASADMRYDRQVVLEMQPGTAAPAPPEAVTAMGAAKDAPVAKAKPSVIVAKHPKQKIPVQAGQR
jgi:cell division protein FtsQ